MSREVKFKFIIYDDKCLVVDVQTATLDEILKAEEAHLPSGFSYKALQYTGLKDKNGKEIYESDVIEIKNVWTHGVGKWSHFVGKVVFFESEFQAKDINDNYLSLHRYKSRIEVIGSLYENPELLKEVK